MILASKRILLRPLVTADYDTLYSMAMNSDSGWRWNGLAAGPEAFRDSLWNGVLTQYAVIAKSNELIGLVSAYHVNLVSGYCYFQIVIKPSRRRLGWPMEAIVLFFDSLFKTYPLRKIYAETSGDSLVNFTSCVGVGAEVEGTFRDRMYSNGEYIDSIVLCVDRVAFYDRAERFLEAIRPDD